MRYVKYATFGFMVCDFKTFYLKFIPLGGVIYYPQRLYLDKLEFSCPKDA